MPWNYDSLFIWFKINATDLQVAYDVTFPQDAHQTADAGITWTPEVRRYYIRVVYNGETCGDVPVSGTLNIIEIPSVSSIRQHVTNGAIVATTSWYDTIRYGAGNLLYVNWSCLTDAAVARLHPLIRCDGNSVFPIIATIGAIYGSFVGESHEDIEITKWDANGHNYAMACTIRYPFKRSLELGFYNSDPVNPHQGTICYSWKQIS